MKTTYLWLLAFTLVAVPSSLLTQKSTDKTSELTHFSAEHSAVKRPVKIPEDVLALLRQDDFGQSGT